MSNTRSSNSPGDPDNTRIGDAEVESFGSWFELQESWGGLTGSQKALVAAKATAGTGIMGRVTVGIVILLISAGLVYVASSDWRIALAVGVLIGLFLSPALRKRPKG